MIQLLMIQPISRYNGSNEPQFLADEWSKLGRTQHDRRRYMSLF